MIIFIRYMFFLPKIGVVCWWKGREMAKYIKNIKTPIKEMPLNISFSPDSGVNRNEHPVTSIKIKHGRIIIDR